MPKEKIDFETLPNLEDLTIETGIAFTEGLGFPFWGSCKKLDARWCLTPNTATDHFWGTNGQPTIYGDRYNDALDFLINEDFIFPNGDFSYEWGYLIGYENRKEKRKIFGTSPKKISASKILKNEKIKSHKIIYPEELIKNPFYSNYDFACFMTLSVRVDTDSEDVNPSFTKDYTINKIAKNKNPYSVFKNKHSKIVGVVEYHLRPQSNGDFEKILKEAKKDGLKKLGLSPGQFLKHGGTSSTSDRYFKFPLKKNN